MNDLDARLEALRQAGWTLSSRETYTLSRPDGDGSVRSFHSDSLDDALVRRVEATSPPKAKLPDGWVALAPATPRPDEIVFSAEKLFEGDPKPVRQSAGTEAGLVRACTSYDLHRASRSGQSGSGAEAPEGPTVDPQALAGPDPEMARRMAATPIHTGLSSTHNYR